MFANGYKESLKSKKMNRLNEKLSEDEFSAMMQDNWINVPNYYRIRIKDYVSYARGNYYEVKNARTLCFGGMASENMLSVNEVLTQGIQHQSEVTFPSEEEAKDFANRFGLEEGKYYVGKSKARYGLAKVNTPFGPAYATGPFIWWRHDHKSSRNPIENAIIKESLTEEIKVVNNGYMLDDGSIGEL